MLAFQKSTVLTVHLVFFFFFFFSEPIGTDLQIGGDGSCFGYSVIETVLIGGGFIFKHISL